MRPDDAALRAKDAAARRVAQSEFDRPLVLEAGAGTGKTTALVARVVAWVLGPGWARVEQAERERARKRIDAPPVDPDRVAARVLSGVVAITFTERAAAEMATRVGEALAALQDGTLPAGVVAEAVPDDEALRATRAGLLLGALDHLVVRTIHAFCRRLLASWPLEAGLHPRFQVDAEGTELVGVIREVVEAKLKTAYADPGDADFLALAGQGIGPQQIADALEILVNSGMPAEALARDPLAAEAVGALRGRLQGHAQNLLGCIEGAVREGKNLSAAQATVAALRAMTEQIAADPLMDVARLAELAAACFAKDSTTQKRLGSWRRGTLTKTEDERFGALLPEVRASAEALHSLVAHLSRLDPSLLQQARQVLWPLLAEVQTALSARGILTFPDLLRGARDLLLRRDDVARQVRRDMDQLLVDEFQDTDRLQCDLVRVLALEGHPEERPGLFLVGDPKQSIYGWRSADLRAYDGFVEQVVRAGGAVHRLSVNFRSAPVILDEVERVVAPHMRARRGVQPAFQPLLASPSRLDDPGFARHPWAPIEHWISWRYDPAGPGPAKKTVAADAAELEADALAADLLGLRERGGLRWSDVALLLRSTGDLDLYLTALRRANIPYAVERDKSYYRRREIIDAAALVRCVLDPNDHLALLTLMRSAMVGVPDAALIPLWSRAFPERVTELLMPDPPRLAALAELVTQASRSLPSDVPGLERVRGWEHSLIVAMTRLAELRDVFEVAPADQFIERLRSAFLVEATEAARYLGHYRLANLDRFFRNLLRALEEGGGDPQVVLRALRVSVAESREAEEGRPKEIAGDAVQVMTIHKAKGLDFQHVYLLQLHKVSREAGRPMTQAEWLESDDLKGEGTWEYSLFQAPTLGWDRVEAHKREVEAAERVRTLYVAMTRPKVRLVMMGLWPLAAARDDDPVAAAKSHADLLGGRVGGVPALAALMGTLGQAGRADRHAEAGATWVFPALSPEREQGRGERSAKIALPAIEEVRRQAKRLAEYRHGAAVHRTRPLGGAASLEAHALLRAQVADRRYGEDAGAEDSGRGPETAAGLDHKQRIALAVGSAVHRALETFDLDADPVEELKRQRGRLAASLRALVGPADLRGAEDRAQSVLDRLEGGALLSRLVALRPHIVARELPVLLPPSAESHADAVGPSGARAVSFVAGAVDLLYRDPDSGQLVVVDYKADELGDGVEAEDRLDALAEAYGPQGEVYRRAVAEALREEPRLELWFLWADRIVTLPFKARARSGRSPETPPPPSRA